MSIFCSLSSIEIIPQPGVLPELGEPLKDLGGHLNPQGRYCFASGTGPWGVFSTETQQSQSVEREHGAAWSLPQENTNPLKKEYPNISIPTASVAPTLGSSFRPLSWARPPRGRKKHPEPARDSGVRSSSL